MRVTIGAGAGWATLLALGKLNKTAGAVSVRTVGCAAAGGLMLGYHQLLPDNARVTNPSVAAFPVDWMN